MGVVYRAMDSVAKRTIALKLINSSMLSGRGAVDRLISEGLLTRDIRHPNVVAVYDVALAGEQPYVTMEYLDGQSLRSWLGTQLTSGGEVTLEAATGIVRAMLDGLDAAHATGIVHRDLKPENVILLGDPNDGDFRLKLLDFGIARAVNVSKLTTSAGAMGTPLYMAPEQRTTPDAAGPAADIYSISRMFYELLMDVLPDGTWQPPSKHRSDIPEKIDTLIEKGLSNRPRSRQQSVAEYRDELKAALGTPAAPAPPKTQERRPAPPPPRPRTEPAKPQPKRSYKAAIIGFGAVTAFVVVLGIIVAALDIETGNSGAGFAVSGTWYDDMGTPWSMSGDASDIYGTGYVNGASANLRGSFTGTVFTGTITLTDTGAYYTVNGTLNSSDLRATITGPTGGGTITYHINHRPGSE